MTTPATRQIPLVDLRGVHEPLLADLKSALERVVLTSGFTGGAEVEKFESEFATYVGARHIVGVSSGTAALHLALRASGVGRGDEVIFPGNTFIATAEAIVAVGARPIPVDVLEATAVVDPDAVDAAITPRTRAVIAVHLYGQPANMDALRAICDRHNLLLVEDAAQAVGARWRGQRVGTLGDVACFSFYPGKNLGALGDAGAIATNDDAIAARVRRLRSHGEDGKYRHLEWGSTDRLDGLQAAFLNVKLAGLEAMQARRDAVVEAYEPALAAIRGVETIKVAAEARSVHHLLVVRVEQRNKVLEGLHRRGVAASVHYPVPVHMQPCWDGVARPGQLPRTEALCATVLSLPLYPGMTINDVRHCVEALADAMKYPQ